MGGEAHHDLPRIDIHGFRTAASPAIVSAALASLMVATLGTRRARLVARLLACRDRGPTRPFRLEEGATVAGFRVTEIAPDRIVVDGEHRFARYAVVIEFPRMLQVTSVSAETKAVFPGFKGHLYRALVIGSGAHRRVMQRFLRRLKKRAEIAHQSS